MATTIWNGQKTSYTVSINNIKQTTNISQYCFDVKAGTSTAPTATTATANKTNSYTVTLDSNVSSSKTWAVAGRLKYSSGKYSNNATNTITVKQQLNSTSITGITLNPSWVWSNADATTITVTASKSGSYPPYSTNCTIPAYGSAGGEGGYFPAKAAGDLNSSNQCSITWYPGTGLSTQSRKYYVDLKSTTTSASAAATVRSAELEIRNALTGLAVSDFTVFKGDTANTKAVTFTPSTPYSKALTVIAPSSGTSGASAVSVKDGVLTLNTSTAGTYKFRVQSAANVSNATAITSSDITFTVTNVTAITGKNFTEGSSISVTNCGVGTLKSASFTSGGTGLKVTTSGSGITISNSADISANTTFIVTVTGNGGATNTVSGQCNVLSVNINPGDTYTITISSIGTVSKVQYCSTATGTFSDTASTIATSTTAGVISGLASGTVYIKYIGQDNKSMVVPVTITNIGLALS